jgi:uncharacterized membrane protein
MYDLIAIGFKGTHRASEVLGQVQQLTDSWAIDLRDAVAVYRGENGKLHLDQSVQPTEREGAAWGGLLGGLLGACGQRCCWCRFARAGSSRGGVRGR